MYIGYNNLRRVLAGIVSGFYGSVILYFGFSALSDQLDHYNPNNNLPVGGLMIFGVIFLLGAPWIEQLIELLLRKILYEPAQRDGQRIAEMLRDIQRARETARSKIEDPKE